MIYVILFFAIVVIILGFWLLRVREYSKKQAAEQDRLLNELHRKEDSIRLLEAWQKEYKEIKDDESKKAAEIAEAESDEDVMGSVRDIVARNNERVQNDKKRNSAAARTRKDGAAGA